jgi:hypothetical protein
MVGRKLQAPKSKLRQPGTKHGNDQKHPEPGTQPREGNQPSQPGAGSKDHRHVAQPGRALGLLWGCQLAMISKLWIKAAPQVVEDLE